MSGIRFTVFEGVSHTGVTRQMTPYIQPYFTRSEIQLIEQLAKDRGTSPHKVVANTIRETLLKPLAVRPREGSS